MSQSFREYLTELAADAHAAVETLLPEEQRSGYKSDSSEHNENNDSIGVIVDNKQQEVSRGLNDRSLNDNETSKETIIMACLTIGFILGLLVGYYLL